MDQFIKLTYEVAERWYREHLSEAIEIIQSSYLFEKTPLGKVTRKVDMTRGYMKEDIGYSIILLSRVMGFPTARHLNVFMITFIETIKTTRMPLDWATTLSENLCEQLGVIKDMVYLLEARAKNYPRLYKRGNM